jgi:hypothetical protein
VFDRCEDGSMLRHEEVARAHAYVQYLHEHYRKLSKPALDAMIKI